MARYTVENLLADFAAKLTERYGIDVSVRYFRLLDVGELPNAPAYYLEPGTLVLNRRNVASPEVVQTVRFLSESLVPFSEAPAALASTLAFFEGVARDFLRDPFLNENAFFQSAATFADAPSGFSVSPLEDGVSAIFGGFEFTFSIT